MLRLYIENTIYNDLTLFIPYDELHMSKGKFDLKTSISIFENSNPDAPKEITTFRYVHFYYSSD